MASNPTTQRRTAFMKKHLRAVQPSYHRRADIRKVKRAGACTSQFSGHALVTELTVVSPIRAAGKAGKLDGNTAAIFGHDRCTLHFIGMAFEELTCKCAAGVDAPLIIRRVSWPEDTARKLNRASNGRCTSASTARSKAVAPAEQ